MFKHYALFICIAVLSAVVLSACAVPEVTSGNALSGSGKYATRDYALDGFTGIQATGGFQVTVTGGDSYKVSVTSDDNVLDSISVKKQAKDLVISFDTSKYSSIRTTKLQVAVTLPELESVRLNGGSSLQSVGAAPKSMNLSINANGGSKVDLGGMAADKVSVTLNGGSRATVNAKTSLDYDLNGGSQLRYTGNPTIGSHKSEGGSQATKF